MRRRPAALLPVLLAAVLGGCGYALVADRYYHVDGAQARAVAARAEAIVDLRPSVDYDAGHIPGAVSIPLSQLWSRMDELPDDHGADVLLYEDDPGRLARGALLMKAEGYYRAHALDGGFEAWRRAGGAVSVEPAPPPGYGRGVETW